MVEAERPKDPIKVKRGEPFSVIPDFTTLPLEVDRGELICVTTVVVEIEGLGMANINFSLDAAFEDQDPIETPAGPVNVTRILDNNSGVFDVRTLPVVVDVEVYGASKDILSASKCKMQIGKHEYQGELSVDEIRLDREARQPINAACFYSWMRPGADKSPEVYFPQQPVVFEKVKFIIN